MAHQSQPNIPHNEVGAPPERAAAEGANSPALATGAGDEGGTVQGGAATKGRILVLEDDAAYCGIIRDYLAESGYAVVAVGSGAEGIREVVASDFTAVLCDFMMPGLPGDMFYRAIERIRPALCQGFIFMTGHRNDARTNAFIESVNGFVLRKPFPLSHVLDSIALAEVRRTYQSVCTPSLNEPEVSRPPQQTGSLPSGGNPPRKKVARMHSPARSLPLPELAPLVNPGVLAADRPTVAGPVSTEVYPDGKPRRKEALWALGFLVLLTVILWNRYSVARDGVAAAMADRRAQRAQWTEVSRKLEEAVALRPKLEREKSQWTRLLADRKNPRLSAILRGVVPREGEEIEIVEISARGETEESGPEEVHIRGVAHGPQPRSVADRYQQAVAEALKKSTDGRLSTALFKLLEDAPGAVQEPERAPFEVTVSFGVAEPSAAVGKEEP